MCEFQARGCCRVLPSTDGEMDSFFLVIVLFTEVILHAPRDHPYRRIDGDDDFRLLPFILHSTGLSWIFIIYDIKLA